MDANTQESTGLSRARERSATALLRLARGEDRRDAELIGACCWPDSTTDYGVFVGTFDAVPRLGRAGLPGDTGDAACPGAERHRAEAATRPASRPRSLSYHRDQHGQRRSATPLSAGATSTGWRSASGQWRIARRTMLYDWFQDFGVSIDWSKGVMGSAVQCRALSRQGRPAITAKPSSASDRRNPRRQAPSAGFDEEGRMGTLTGALTRG
jgi:hypothetical protein